MNTDIRLSIGFWQHPKTRKLVKRLGLEGARSLQILWLWVSQNRPDGVLSGMDWEDIELAADWQGEEHAFFDHCLGVWIDEGDGVYVLHDWQDHNPWQAEAAARSEQARQNAKNGWNKRRAMQPQSDGNAAAMQPHANGIAKSMQPQSDGNAAAMQPHANGNAPLLTLPIPEDIKNILNTPLTPQQAEGNGGGHNCDSTQAESPRVFNPPPGLRKEGTNPRSQGTNSRKTGNNPRALGSNPRNREQSEKPTDPADCGQEEPSMEFLELRELWDKEMRCEGPGAGFREYKALKKARDRTGLSCWPGLGVIRDDVYKRKTARFWNQGYEIGLGRYLAEKTWLAPIVPRASPQKNTELTLAEKNKLTAQQVLAELKREEREIGNAELKREEREIGNAG